MASGNPDNKGKAVLNDDDMGEPVRSSAVPPPPPVIHTGSQSQQLDNNQILLIKHAMQRCVIEIEAGNTGAASSALSALASVSSLDGAPIARVTSAFAEALARRALAPLHGLSWSVLEQVRRPPTNAHADVARQWFHALSPLLQAASLAANHAILRACEGEQDVHVVDLGGANPRQWIDLLRLLAARPGGPPPSLRITIVSAAELLAAEAARLRLPGLAFIPVRAHIDDVSPAVVAALGVRRGGPAALVLSSTLQLHRLLADAAVVGHETVTRADALLRVLRDLSPKLLVLTEQEADHNAAGVWDRVSSAFDHYAVLFNDLEVCRRPRNALDRTIVERVHLREEIMDIVAREGAARRERHEKMARWEPRMAAAGFQPAPLAMERFKETTRLENRRADGDREKPLYRVSPVREKGCFFVHSCLTPMFSVSLWKPAAATVSEAISNEMMRQPPPGQPNPWILFSGGRASLVLICHGLMHASL